MDIPTQQAALSQAKELLLQQPSLTDQKLIFKFIDGLSRINPPLLRASLEQLIIFLQKNADANDYLNRKEVNAPIDFLPEVPAIYKSIKVLVDLAVKLYESEMGQMNDAEFHTLANKMSEKGVYIEVSREELVGYILDYYRRQLVSGIDPQSKEIGFWRGIGHYFGYPKDKYQQNRHTYDRLDIDNILKGTHYSTLPFEKAMFLDSVEHQLQPGYARISTDEALQYDPKTGECERLLSRYSEAEDTGRKDWEYREEDESKDRGRFPVRLLSADITNCHTVLVRDDQNRFFMLHVSPASVSGGADNPFFFRPPKTAYLDLHPNYKNPAMGLQGGEIEVVVVDRGGYFDETQFKSMLPANVTVKNLAVLDPEFEYGRKYSVCFTPDQNKLVVLPYSDNLKLIEYDNVFPPLELQVKLKAN